MPGRDEARLRWRCRRGLLELDLVLGEFVATRYGSLTAAEQKSFQRLLTYPDQALLDMLLRGGDIADAAIADIVDKIRQPADC